MNKKINIPKTRITYVLLYSNTKSKRYCVPLFNTICSNIPYLNYIISTKLILCISNLITKVTSPLNKNLILIYNKPRLNIHCH